MGFISIPGTRVPGCWKVFRKGYIDFQARIRALPERIFCEKEKGLAYVSSWALLVPSCRQRTRSRMPGPALNSSWRRCMLEETECDVLEKYCPKGPAYSLYVDQGSGRAAKRIHVVSYPIILPTHALSLLSWSLFFYGKSRHSAAVFESGRGVRLSFLIYLVYQSFSE